MYARTSRDRYHRTNIILQTAVNFGLINKTYSGYPSENLTQWQQFIQVVNSLNADADLNTVYKVLFLGRHGEGFHNTAESYYGTPAWNVRQKHLESFNASLTDTLYSATGQS